MKPVVTAIIPSRNEQFLYKTTLDLLEKAVEPIEIICLLDGYWPDPNEIIDDVRVKYIHRGTARGMRSSINSGAAIAQGDYLWKTDGHCMVSEGWDRECANTCQDNWIIIPRRKRLDAENWTFTDEKKPDIDYMYLAAPKGAESLKGVLWDEKNKDAALKEVELDDLMSAQGSAWFMPRPYFQHLELMDESQYGTFWNEFQEIGLKCWLSGGEVKVDKRCWYAHLHKGAKYGRGYALREKGTGWTNKWVTEPVGVAWHKADRPLSWLIEKFWPVPTWSEDRAEWGINEA